MSLPTFDVPRHSVKLPSNKEAVQFRPFLVKEQKQLLMALGGSKEEQITAIEHIVNACTFNKVDARRLAAFDVEYLFLQIRAKSIGEKVELQLSCGCGVKTQADLDITTVEVAHNEHHSDTIDLGSDILVKLRYPRIQDIEQMGEPNPDDVIRLIAGCIQSIWRGEEMFASEDYTMQDLVEFVEGLSPSGYDKLENLLATMPVLRHKLDWTCAGCGTANSISLEGMQSFFA